MAALNQAAAIGFHDLPRIEADETLAPIRQHPCSSRRTPMGGLAATGIAATSSRGRYWTELVEDETYL